MYVDGAGKKKTQKTGKIPSFLIFIQILSSQSRFTKSSNQKRITRLILTNHINMKAFYALVSLLTVAHGSVIRTSPFCAPGPA